MHTMLSFYSINIKTIFDALGPAATHLYPIPLLTRSMSMKKRIYWTGMYMGCAIRATNQQLFFAIFVTHTAFGVKNVEHQTVCCTRGMFREMLGKSITRVTCASCWLPIRCPRIHNNHTPDSTSGTALSCDRCLKTAPVDKSRVMKIHVKTVLTRLVFAAMLSKGSLSSFVHI
jgi:hypothetical protein